MVRIRQTGRVGPILRRMTGKQAAQTAAIALMVVLAFQFLSSGDPRARALRERAQRGQ